MNKQSKAMIDLSIVGGRTYVGRLEGQNARILFKLDDLDEIGNFPVQVKFPENSKALASSFFLGLFSQSIIAAGSKEEFLNRYQFSMPEIIKVSVDQGIKRALISQSVVV